MIGLHSERYKESELSKPKVKKSNHNKKELARKKKPKEKNDNIFN